MNLYDMNGHDYVAANSLIDAMSWYEKNVDADPDMDTVFDNPCEVSDYLMKRWKFFNEDGTTSNFKDAFYRDIREATGPFLFASTEF